MYFPRVAHVMHGGNLNKHKSQIMKNGDLKVHVHGKSTRVPSRILQHRIQRVALGQHPDIVFLAEGAHFADAAMLPLNGALVYAPSAVVQEVTPAKPQPSRFFLVPYEKFHETAVTHFLVQ